MRQSSRNHHVSRRNTSFESITAPTFSPGLLVAPASEQKHHLKKFGHHRRELSQPSSRLQESSTQFSSFPREPDREIVLTSKEPLQSAPPPDQCSQIHSPQNDVKSERSFSLETTPHILVESGKDKKSKTKKRKRHGFSNPFRRRHRKVIMDLVANPSMPEDGIKAMSVPSLFSTEGDGTDHYLPDQYENSVTGKATWIQHGTPSGIDPPRDALIIVSPTETCSTLGQNYQKKRQRPSILHPVTINTLDSGVYTEMDSGPATFTSPEIEPRVVFSQEESAPPPTMQMEPTISSKLTSLVDKYAVACQVGDLRTYTEDALMLSVACQHGVCQTSTSVGTESAYLANAAEDKPSTSGKKMQVGKPWWKQEEESMENSMVETVDSSAQTTLPSSHDYVNLPSSMPTMFEIGLQTNLIEPMITVKEPAAITFCAPPEVMGNEPEEICIESSDSEAIPTKRQTQVIQSSPISLVNTSVQTDNESQPKKAKIMGISCELQFQDPGVTVAGETDAQGSEFSTTLEHAGTKNLRFHVNFEDKLSRNHN